MLTTEQIEEKFNSLPEELKEIISGIDFATIIPTLGEKYGLTIDKQGTLHGKINLLMLGAISASDFESEAQSELGLSPEQAEKILLDVDEIILTPIRMDYLGMEELVEEEVGGPAKTQPSDEGQVNITTEAERKRILEGIENPSNLIKQKMTGAFSLPKEETDYSIRKIDPYREKLE